jgi:hypothetical protein
MNHERIETSRSVHGGWGIRVAVAAVLAVLLCVSVFVYRTDRLAMPRRARVATLAAAWVLGCGAAVAAYRFMQAKRRAEEEEPDEATPEHVFVPEAVAQALAAEANAAAEAEQTAAQTQAPAQEPQPTEEPAAAETAQPAAPAASEAAAAHAYWTRSGKTYHLCRACTALARSKDVLEGTLEDAQKAGKKSACNYCAGEKA